MDMHADVQNLEAFRDHAAELIETIGVTRRSITLTVNGRDAAVVQDMESHRRLLNLAAQASTEEGIRQGLEDLAAGRVMPAQDAFDLLRAEFGIPR